MRFMLGLLAAFSLFANADGPDVKALSHDAVRLETQLFDDLAKYCFTMRIFQEEPGDEANRKRETRVEYVCFRDGVPVYKRLEINGKPTGVKIGDPFPPPDDEWRKRAERIREARKTQVDIMQQALKAFTATYAGETTLEGRAVYIVDLQPNPEYRAVSRTTELLKSVRGRVWIDKETHNLVKVQARTFRDFTIWGGLLARIKRGAAFEMRQKLFQGTWLPYFLEQNWEGKVAVVKRIGDHVRLERSDFQVGSADSVRRAAQ